MSITANRVELSDHDAELVNGGQEPPDFGDLARLEMAVSLGRIRSPPSSSDFF